MRPFSRQSGQAAVETAIVMPLFVFTVLGIMQLSLLHQARLLTKYAAYKAARSGAINRASMDVMERAAISVMLPMITRETPIANGSGGEQPQYGLYKISDAQEFVRNYKDVADQRRNESAGRQGSAPKKLIEVTVCHPLSGDLTAQKDFDDPDTNNNMSDWKAFENSKLSIQVTTYLHLIVPFANAFIWWSARGKFSQQRADTMKSLRMETDSANSENTDRKNFNGQYTLRDLEQEAERGSYIIPVRASYSYRMHSNLGENVSLPQKNLCHVPFEKKE
ncbi:MAG: pilus assembly protein [Archangium sp.]